MYVDEPCMRAGSVRGELLLRDLDVYCDDYQSITSNADATNQLLRRRLTSRGLNEVSTTKFTSNGSATDNIRDANCRCPAKECEL
jgi:hypothetical protein